MRPPLATRAAVLVLLFAAPAVGCTIRCADGVERSDCRTGGDSHTFYGGAGGRLLNCTAADVQYSEYAGDYIDLTGRGIASIAASE